ncbi:tetrathionate reductase [Vibrio inusitatus NBRC 102082]|uniref:Tetrathionate reductase n=1 Tax=Vibrio inusitatus NBRC 102082 TaxID=1219070 RepID=A0A4Y3HYU0_9VIBR|nr:NrfD/PsrC family molybdoenzyme membrane anchor subunit [Vibrio inusitatus]GEA51880.1 tetrathionate reductase [Vibrio inusitatus NBRC 102082]
MIITEVLVPSQAVAWLPWAVQYFFYIGSAYAAAILFLIALVFSEHTSHRMRSAFALTMAIGAIVGPLALTGDLHQPGRAWHFYTHLTPWSWMSLGSLFLPVFSATTIAAAWLYLRADLIRLQQHPSKVFQLLSKLSLGDWKTSKNQMLISASIAVLSGLSIALYTGAEIAVVQARSLWHQPASPIIWFVTAFFGAVGFSLLITLLIPTRSSDTLSNGDRHLLKRTTSICSVLSLLVLFIWAAGNQSFSLFDSNQWLLRLSALFAMIICCFVVAFCTLRTSSKRRFGLAILSMITLATAWAVRWVTMIDVQTIPKFDLGPYPYELPMGGSGLLGIFGMFGLWMALALLGSELVQTEQQSSSQSLLSEQ